jgi:AcrR family transcriptional regulator
MPRRYDSTRRIEAAQRTKEGILEAAFKLHGRGILDFDSLAREANVSQATVRKYFSTREELYAGCTDWGMQFALVPRLHDLAAIEEPEERLRECISQLHRFYDSLFGQMWMAHLHRESSEVLQRLLGELENLQTSIVNIALAPWEKEPGSAQVRGLMRGLVSFLTYRALISEGGLTPQQATDWLTSAQLSSLQTMTLDDRREGLTV